MNPDAVRPGTSDALFARTIDATIYPPLVRAQETAVTLIPRVAHAAAPLASPLFLGALALTLVFSWVAIRMRYRPRALVLGVLLVMTLTSFNPVQKPEQSRIADVRIPRTTVGGTRHRPPDFAEPLPDWGRGALQSAARMMRENEQVRKLVKQIRNRLREEARRQRWREMTARANVRPQQFDLIDSP